MKQILFILIFLFAFTVQIEVKNKTLETVKFRNIKYDPRNIFRTNSIEICGPGKIYLCDSKNSCSCVLRNNIKYITTKTTKQLNVSSKINEIIKPKTTRFFTHSFIKKCLPGFVYECTYKKSKFSFHSYRDCDCKPKKPKCEEGYSYKCTKLPGMFPANSKMKRPTICQCEKDYSFMKNNKRNSTFISSKN